MNILWSPGAIQDLAALRPYIAEDDPAAASRVALRIVGAVKQLAETPHIGRPGRVPGTRELMISRAPYVVPYRVRRRTLEVLRVYHGARRWPDSF